MDLPHDMTKGHAKYKMEESGKLTLPQAIEVQVQGPAPQVCPSLNGAGPCAGRHHYQVFGQAMAWAIIDVLAIARALRHIVIRWP